MSKSRLIRAKTIDRTKTMTVAQLKQELSSSNNTADQIEKLVELGKIYVTDEPKIGLSYLDRAIQLLEYSKNKELKGKAFFNRGRNFTSLGRFSEAIESFHEAEYYFKEAGNIQGVSDVWGNLGEVYLKNSKEKDAVECFLKSLEQNVLIRNYRGISRDYNNVGRVYFQLSDYDNALRYYNKAYETATEHLSDLAIYSAVYYNNCAAIYFEKKAYHKALDYLEKALPLAENAENWQSVGIYLANIGEIHLKLNDYINALSYLTKALHLKRKKDLPFGLPTILINLSNLSFRNNRLKKALEFAEEGMHMALKHNAADQITNGYKVLVLIYKKLSNYEKALHYQELLQQHTEEQYKQEKEKEFLKLKKQFELSERDHEIKLQKLQLEKQELELQEKHKVEQINTRLEELVEERTYKLKLKNKQLEAFAHVVAYDLKNPIRNIGSFSGLILKRYKKELPDEAREYVEFVSLNAKYLYRQFEDLLLYASLQDPKYPEEPINVGSVVKTVMSSLLNSIIDHKVIFQIGKLPTMHVEEYHLLQIFQNLIENAIHYRDENRKTIIKIQAKSADEGYIFSIKDNGIGIELQYQRQVFQLFYRLGRQEYGGTGMGLSISKKIVELYRGRMWVESVPNEGTIFSFYLPNVPNKY